MRKLGERIWNKFHQIFGSDLKVGFETTFPKGEVPAVDSLYRKSGLIHDPPSETVVRICEPARITGSCCDGGEKTQVLFVPVPQRGAIFRRLVFARKIGEGGYPRKWMIVARHGEVATFGFDSWNSKDPRYLALAYPGGGDEFAQTYIKIQDVNGGFVYLELGAWDDEVQVLFTAGRVNEGKVPKLLKNLEVQK